MPESEFSIKEPAPNLETLAKHVNFLRSDHIRFWFANHQDYFASFPAMYVSDTGPARGIMKDCYHNTCDDAKFNATNQAFASLPMIAKVTQATIDLLIEFQDCQNYSNDTKLEDLEARNSRRLHYDFQFWDKTTNSSIISYNPKTSLSSLKTEDEDTEAEDKQRNDAQAQPETTHLSLPPVARRKIVKIFHYLYPMVGPLQHQYLPWWYYYPAQMSPNLHYYHYKK